MKKEEFKKLYNEKTNQELADYLGVSKQTIINYAKKLGIKQKGKGNRQKKAKIIID